MRCARYMALLCRFKRQECVYYLRVSLRVCPVFGNLSPFNAQASIVGVAVLDDEGAHPLRLRQDDAETHRRTIIMQENRIVSDFQLLQKIANGLCQMIEGIA